MPSSSFLGKHGPLALLAAAQLLIIVLVPSTAHKANANYAQGGYAAGAGGAGGAAGAAGGGPGGTAAGGVGGAGGIAGAGGGAGATGAGGAAGAAGSGGGTGSLPNGAAATGDKSHCVSDRQFDPGIDFFAPPCVPGLPGAAFANNGGNTWQGVTKDRIEIVNYVPDYGAEVNTILQAQGLYYNKKQAEQFNAAFEKFINSKYQLYGRKVHIDTFQGTCSTVPPKLECLIPEMDKMVATYHPYAVLFSTTVCSACFQELARLRVVSTGGAGFSDEFHNANAPYSYDLSMSATQVERSFADWWCSQMTSQGGTGRTAIFAGTQNSAQNFRNKPRVLGVVSTNDQDNERTVKNVLYPALKRGCGETVTHEYFYAQDINTATQQSNAGTAAMNTPTNPATSVLCLCDPVAPQFAQNGATNQNYWPESLIATNQTMDFDSTGQTYSDSNSLACPQKSRGCAFDNAIGLGSADPQVPVAQMPGVKIYKMMTGSDTTPVQPPVMDIFWGNYNLLASLIQNTGPFLTPARMQAAAPSMGGRGGGTTGHALRAFRKGSWCWTQDVRVTYWNKHAKSPYNGQAGHWISIEGRRFELGQFPKLREPPAPPAEKRV